MISNSGVGSVSIGEDRTFNGVKIFSATMMAGRSRLGDKVTDWLHENPQAWPRDIVVTQSSDEAFHCIAITVFYWEDL